MPRPTFEQAKAMYVHRFTMEHVPAWAFEKRAEPNRTFDYYAPHFRTDREWYENTKFRGDDGYCAMGGDCQTTGQTWPLGQGLSAPYLRRAA